MRSRARWWLFVVVVEIAALSVASAATPKTNAKTDPSAQLGSPTFRPTPDRPIGWRGDGSGNYPGATPPTTWDCRVSGGAVTSKNILWRASLPNIGVSSPIIVGDQIFLTTEVADLVCLDKKTGRVLWIRSNPEFEGLDAAELKAEPAYAEKLAPLSRQLAAVNDTLVQALNSGLPPTAPQCVAVINQKKDVEKQIHDEQLDIDKKGYTHNWAQAVFGYSGPTPTSDGTHVCAFFTTGVSVCYDLHGNRQWIHRGAGGGSEHGNFASPLLIGGRLVVWANEMRGYDVLSGKLLWTAAAKAFNTYGSLFGLRSGRDLVAGFQWGFFVRVRDGQPIWDNGAFGDSVTTPIVVGNTIFAHGGYPKVPGDKGAFGAFGIPSSTDGGKLIPLRQFQMDWADDELTIDKKKNPFDRGYVCSPLFVNGLIYQVTQGGGLMVNDAATGELVYKKVLPLHPRTEYWNWAGCAASPTYAGKYIYLMDNQGHTIVIEPGRQYKEVAQNVIEEESKDGKQEQNLATPVFEGTRMYWRTPAHLYCIGAK